MAAKKKLLKSSARATSDEQTTHAESTPEQDGGTKKGAAQEQSTPGVPAGQPAELNESEKLALAKYIERFRSGQQEGKAALHKLADVCYQIQQQKLYRKYATEAAFFKAELGLSRSGALRLAKMGRVLNRLSPLGDNARLLSTDAHFRPLLKLNDGQQDAAIELARKLAAIAGVPETSAQLVETAVILLNPPTQPKEEPDSPEKTLAAKFHHIVETTKGDLPQDVSEPVRKLFDKMAKQALALGGPLRSSLIDWTDAIWDNQEGCTSVSDGCGRCWAAKLMATRMSDIYPGLAKKLTARGRCTCVFTGKLVLSPEHLADPLKDRVPKRYFVNSRSDTFHPKVPDDYIDMEFSVMEAAWWHQFQMLTKRPERMAAYTQKRYRDKQPPKNIWCGTSVEDQKHYDERSVHLRNTKAAVLWLSVEPMLGPIKFGDLSGIGWMVVGGESDSVRRMEKGWVLDARNQCIKAKVPFFFKQWGDFNEDGEKVKGKVKKDRLVPATLDGVVYNAYPEISA